MLYLKNITPVKVILTITKWCNYSVEATGWMEGSVSRASNVLIMIDYCEQWRHQAGARGLSPQTCRSAPPLPWSILVKNQEVDFRNFQILIVSAVKRCKQCLQIASASGNFVPQTHWWVRCLDTPVFCRVVSTYMWTSRLFRMHEIWSVDSQKKYRKVVATRCQILGSISTKFDIPHWKLTAFPRPPSCI